MDEKVLFNEQQQPIEATKPPVSEFVKPSIKPVVLVSPPAPPPIPEVDSSSGVIRKIIAGFVVVVLVAILAFFFWPKGNQKKVNLVWWGLWEDARVMQPLIADFEKENPSITIEYSKQDPKQYRERLTTRIQNNTGPDIFRYHNTWYPMFSDILLPLPSDVITQAEFKNFFYPVIQKDLTHNGAIYGLPLGIDSLGLFVNTDLLTAVGVNPPTTWDEFVKAAKTLTVKDETGKITTAGAAFGTYANVSHAPDIVSLLFIQQGVDFNKISTSSQDQSDALDFYTSFAKGDQATWNSSLDSSLILFSQGRLAMYFGYSWDIFTIQRLNKDLKFKVLTIPSLFKRNMTIASYWVEGVSVKGTHQKEALLFMKYLSKKETAQKFYSEAAKTRAFGELYARTDLADTLKSNDLIYPFVSQLKNAQSSFFASDTFDGESGFNSMNNTYLGNAINSIANDNSSASTAVEILDQGVTQVFSKYGIQ
ncbi:extracellular solute-binding protein [Candidatus Roizmanbacteria bacterium]|nr:extracellular solute-binding protein [Candidatus Roizmanbacteria bacterium]